LKINCILKFGSLSDEDYIEFFCNVFDPYQTGYVSKRDYVSTVEQLFNSQFAADIAEEDKDSMSADIKNKFLQFETEDNCLDVNSFRSALTSCQLDIDLFK